MKDMRDDDAFPAPAGLNDPPPEKPRNGRVRTWHFWLCMAGYAVFMSAALTLKIPEDTKWYYIVPMLLLAPVGGVAMQIIPYLYLTDFFIRRGYKSPVPGVTILWACFLCAYAGIIITGRGWH